MKEKELSEKSENNTKKEIELKKGEKELAKKNKLIEKLKFSIRREIKGRFSRKRSYKMITYQKIN